MRDCHDSREARPAGSIMASSIAIVPLAMVRVLSMARENESFLVKGNLVRVRKRGTGRDVELQPRKRD
jgi:hypothetical protein